MMDLVRLRRVAWLGLCLMLYSFAAFAAEKKIMCYDGEFSRDIEVQWMRLLIPPDDSPKLWFGQWGMPTVTFYSSLDCDTQTDGSFRCTEDTCEGDYVSALLSSTTDGDILLHATGEGADLDIMSVLIGPDAQQSQYGLEGIFLLKKQSTTTCAGWENAHSRSMKALALRSGDFGQPVQMVEESLSKLGYFTDQPDRLYTDETARAAAAFQRATLLPETGIVDLATWEKLSLVAVVGSGQMC